MPKRPSAMIGLCLLGAALGACGSDPGLGGDDQDGVVGGDFPFVVTVDDSGYQPTAIWKAQNFGNVTFTLTNGGTRAHGFFVRCLGTRCFPKAAEIAPLAPGETGTAKFQVPQPEGIFDVDDGTGVVPGPTGQFIVQ